MERWEQDTDNDSGNVPSLPLTLRVPTPKEYTRHHSGVQEYTYQVSRCMGYRHRRGQPIGILSLTLSSHPGENQVSAPELFCLAVAASEQLYLAIKARNVPSFFTVSKFRLFLLPEISLLNEEIYQFRFGSCQHLNQITTSIVLLKPKYQPPISDHYLTIVPRLRQSNSRVWFQ